MYFVIFLIRSNLVNSPFGNIEETVHGMIKPSSPCIAVITLHYSCHCKAHFPLLLHNIISSTWHFSGITIIARCFGPRSPYRVSLLNLYFRMSEIATQSGQQSRSSANTSLLFKVTHLFSLLMYSALVALCSLWTAYWPILLLSWLSHLRLPPSTGSFSRNSIRQPHVT